MVLVQPSRCYASEKVYCVRLYYLPGGYVYFVLLFRRDDRGR